MPCIRRPISKDQQTIGHLVGSTKCFSQKEMFIYSQASLCPVLQVDQGQHIQPEPPDSVLSKHILFKPCTVFPKPWMRQTYKQWKASMDLGFRLGQIKKRKVVYMLPLGTPDYLDFIHNFQFDGNVGFFPFLKTFCEIFFDSFEVRLMDAVDTSDWKITRRIHNKTQQEQLLASDLQHCLQRRLPKDGYCIVGISWTDLYPQEKMNFTLGDANAGLNSAVFCFGRFRPKTFIEGQPSPPTITCIDGDIVWRMIKVICHETCHLLGMAHCTYFDCLMNESTSMEQAMEQPLFLCPVCLRKLHKTTKFDMERRYNKLLTFLESINEKYYDTRIESSICWLKRALIVLNQDKARNKI